jgi:hypothetical protein
MIHFISTVFFVLLFSGIIWGVWFYSYKERELIKTILQDVIFLYKNFVHWNISKIFIWAFAWWLAIIISIPFFILFLIVLYYSNIGLSFLTTPWILINFPFLVTTFLFYIASLLFWISYYKVTLINLNLKYEDWEKIGYMKNIYFDFEKILKYFKLLLWMLFYVVLPMIIFVVLFTLFYLMFLLMLKDPQLVVNSTFSIISLFLLIISSWFTFYMMYRVSFSPILLCDDDEDHSAKFYVLKSVEITKWFHIFAKFISVMVVFILPMLPFIYMWNSLEKERRDIYNYLEYNDKSKKNKISDWDYQNLYMTYSDKSEQELEDILNKNGKLNFLYYILSFLFMYWVIEMVRVSFYKNVFVSKEDEEQTWKLSLIRKFISSFFKKEDKMHKKHIEDLKWEEL